MSEPEYGENRGISEIRNALEDMIEKMYLERHDDSPIKFSASTFGKTIDVANQANLNWEEVVEISKEKAREVLSPDDAEKYISEYCEGDGLIVTHPVTGETLNLTEETEFDQRLETAEKGLADEVEESPWRDVRHQYDGSSDQATTDGGRTTESK